MADVCIQEFRSYNFKRLWSESRRRNDEMLSEEFVRWRWGQPSLMDD
jgi:hypothetical protein